MIEISTNFMLTYRLRASFPRPCSELSLHESAVVNAPFLFISINAWG